ncbi:MAG: UDP-3-O-acyl-N-acetylglucosamine deacetylase [Gammaproteobacteria bacterium]
MKQKTIRNTIKANGVGAHTGLNVTLTLHPAPANTGIVFKRVDLSPVVEIPAKVEFVGDTMFSTNLMRGKTKIGTVEHLLSAFYGLGIDNAIVEVDAPELPIMDGSSAPFIFLIQSAGIVEQAAPKSFIVIKKPVRIQDGDRWAELRPFNGFKVAYTLDYNHPFLKTTPQTAEVDFSNASYAREVSRARTFGFLSDYEWLKSKNLAQGSSLDNAIVLGEDKIINEGGLRSLDEFVKHKILDAIGDLYLLGFNLIGAFSGYKSGHTVNNLLVKKLLSEADAWDLVQFSEESEVSYLNLQQQLA